MRHVVGGVAEVGQNVRPANRFLCSRMVCRSASTWHGWNWSVSAFTTGTRAGAAASSIDSWPNVRQTIAATCRVITRVVSAIDSRTPMLASLPSTTIG